MIFQLCCLCSYFWLCLICLSMVMCILVSSSKFLDVVDFLLFGLQLSGHTNSSYIGAFLEEYLVLDKRKQLFDIEISKTLRVKE